LDKNKQNIINTIAQELDCGFDCYFNVKTEEIISIPGFSYILDMDDFNDAFEENFKKIETQKSDLIKFEVLQSFESFKIMEDFVAQLPDKNLKEELSIILIQKNLFETLKIELIILISGKTGLILN
jgi:hypothetical protein